MAGALGSYIQRARLDQTLSSVAQRSAGVGATAATSPSRRRAPAPRPQWIGGTGARGLAPARRRWPADVTHRGERHTLSPWHDLHHRGGHGGRVLQIAQHDECRAGDRARVDAAIPVVLDQSLQQAGDDIGVPLLGPSNPGIGRQTFLIADMPERVRASPASRARRAKYRHVCRSSE